MLFIFTWTKAEATCLNSGLLQSWLGLDLNQAGTDHWDRWRRTVCKLFFIIWLPSPVQSHILLRRGLWLVSCYLGTQNSLCGGKCTELVLWAGHQDCTFFHLLLFFSTTITFLVNPQASFRYPVRWSFLWETIDVSWHVPTSVSPTGSEDSLCPPMTPSISSDIPYITLL